LRRDAIDTRCAPDFPSIDPGRIGLSYRDFWMLGISKVGRRGRKFFDQLVHASWSDAGADDVYRAPEGHYLGGEPIYVGAARGGAVICQVFDAGRTASAFVVFDAESVAKGPVATLRLDEPQPFGFHASFLNMQ